MLTNTPKLYLNRNVRRYEYAFLFGYVIYYILISSFVIHGNPHYHFQYPHIY